MQESLNNLQQLIDNNLIELEDYYAIHLYGDSIELQGEYKYQEKK